MRSFVGVVQHDGAAPDERLLRALAERIRLPTSSAALLQIDDRCGLAVVSHLPDLSPLLLDETTRRAWDLWGRECPAHLFGEFSFPIWNAETSELFCARDRFGVRPLFYARTDRAFVFSDSLDAVIAHPDVRVDELDDAAVADYLASGVYNDASATIFRHVRRLPPAHTLLVRAGQVTSRRYWKLTMPEPELRDPVGRLEAALKTAIAERVNSSSAVVFMSGGLDSPTLAALTREVRPDTRLEAGTSVYRTRIPDVEEPFAVEAARSIGIPIRLFPLDDYSPSHALEQRMWTADPGALLTSSMTCDIYALAAEQAPVALHGHPADAVMISEPALQLRKMLRSGRILALAAVLVRYTRIKRRPPYFFVRDLLSRRTERQPRAIRALESAIWSSYFEWAHPLVTRAPVELVYPWCDVRVLEAVLAMEPIPWLVDKYVVRELLRGRVSDTVRRRPKTFLQGNPWAADGDDAALRAKAFEYWRRELPRRVAKVVL